MPDTLPFNDNRSNDTSRAGAVSCRFESFALRLVLFGDVVSWCWCRFIGIHTNACTISMCKERWRHCESVDVAESLAARAFVRRECVATPRGNALGAEPNIAARERRDSYCCWLANRRRCWVSTMDLCQKLYSSTALRAAHGCTNNSVSAKRNVIALNGSNSSELWSWCFAFWCKKTFF